MGMQRGLPYEHSHVESRTHPKDTVWGPPSGPKAFFSLQKGSQPDIFLVNREILLEHSF